MTKKGSIIAELRKEAGYTQKSLADALHITDKAVSKWERGISLPDVSLLPKLSLLLDADVALLLSSDAKPHEGWEGLLNLRESEMDLSQLIYDKPMVYYLLSHYLLLDVRKIHVLCSDRNRQYLSEQSFSEFGFELSFDGKIPDRNLMIMNRPCFLFGSDLTRQFQGSMVSKAIIKLKPEQIPAPFLFCPYEYNVFYFKNPEYLFEHATIKTLGRGMICLDMDNIDQILEIASFVRIYQKSSGMLIGSLEEIAFRKGIISKEKLMEIAEKVPYGNILKQIAIAEK